MVAFIIFLAFAIVSLIAFGIHVGRIIIQMIEAHGEIEADVQDIGTSH